MKLPELRLDAHDLESLSNLHMAPFWTPRAHPLTDQPTQLIVGTGRENLTQNEAIFEEYESHAIWHQAHSGYGMAMATTSASLAGSYDISLRGLGRPAPGNLNDAAYFALSEIGQRAGHKPGGPLAPAETLGVSGFEFAFVTVHADISEEESYWRGQPGSPVLRGVADGNVSRRIFDSNLAHPKRLPMSTELGITASYLAFSEMFLLGVRPKSVFHESYYRWVPHWLYEALLEHAFGSADIKLTTIETDILASLPIGIDGIVQLTPYVGYGMVFVDVISGIIDETPYDVQPADQNGRSDGSLYVFEKIELARKSIPSGIAWGCAPTTHSLNSPTKSTLVLFRLRTKRSKATPSRLDSIRNAL